MKLEHIAIWTFQLEKLKDFYVRFFGGEAGNIYHNPQKNFYSYFICFEGGARLELMSRPDISVSQNQPGYLFTGLTHFAFEVESREMVETLTQELAEAGYEVIGQPRVTGDGYYESVILDPDQNQVEITFPVEKS